MKAILAVCPLIGAPIRVFAGARRKMVVADNHPVGPLGPTDLMDDDSLRRGDAVVTPSGIRIFIGSSGSHHAPEDFRKLSEIKGLSKVERKALALWTPKVPVRTASQAWLPGQAKSNSFLGKPS